MESFYSDEEKEIMARRAARREQMRREKQLQEQRRRMIKKMIPVAAGAMVFIIAIIVGIIAFVKAPDRNNTEKVQTELADASGAEGKMQESEKEISGIPSNGNTQENTEEDVTEALGEAITGENNGAADKTTTPTGRTKNMSAAPIYTFESNASTSGIYSEEVISTNAILINESTDTIVASKGEKQRICPASMTKVLTVLVAAEHITEEDLDDTFTMTIDITDYAYVNDCSSVGFLDGEKVTVRDLFYGTVLPSGGDAAVGLATYIAGSHEAFVDLMNEKLEELGLSDSAHFTNCVGLYDDNHYCTVYDMAVMMKAAMQNELCREFLSAHTYKTAPTQEHPEGIEVSNWFLRRIEDKDTGGEVLCAKTGYVVQSKNCAVSYGTFADGVPYICVTAGSTSSWRCIYDHVEIYNRYVM